MGLGALGASLCADHNPASPGECRHQGWSCQGSNVVTHEADLLMVTAAQADVEISVIQRHTQSLAALVLWKCSVSLFLLSLAVFAQC